MFCKNFKQKFSNCSAGTAVVGYGIPERFEYTLNDPKLNNAQRAFYEENGFLVIKNLVPEHLLDKWRYLLLKKTY